MRTEDEIDLLLDSALSTYADPGDEAGLVQRVLARVAEEHVADRRAPRWGLRLLIALPAAACVLLLVLWAFKTPHTAPTSAEQSHLPGANQAAEKLNTQGGGGFNPVRRGEPTDPAWALAPGQRFPQISPGSPRPITVAANSAPLPKLDVFPTPRPLTAEEKALALVAVKTPAPELEALAKADDEASLPVSIATVHIPPLEPPDEGEN